MMVSTGRNEAGILKRRIFVDRIAGGAMFALTVLSCTIVLLIAASLYMRARPILELSTVRDLIFSSSWRPLKGEFGFFPFIMGTVWVTFVAVAIAVPLAILTAIYLSEYVNALARDRIKPFIDLLAGIPSVVYGVWGVLVIVPAIRDHVAPFFGRFSTGYSVLAAGVVLSIMILPVIIHVCLEVFSSISDDIRDASLSVGATKWQTVKYVILRKAMPGIIAAVVLGVSRAFGETMAVLMVAGNVSKPPSSVLDPAYPLPALIANNYGEMMSVPLYDAALLLASLMLLVIILIFNAASRIVLVRVERSL